jgi:hypothetical protein
VGALSGGTVAFTFDLRAGSAVLQAALVTQPQETMKPRFLVVCLALLLAGSAFTPVLRAANAPAAKPESPAVTQARNARLADLKRQHAATVAEIQRLRAKIHQNAGQQAAHARQGNASLPKDSLSELGSEDTLKLQQMMDRKSQLEEMISNVMKESSDASNSIIGNLK